MILLLLPLLLGLIFFGDLFGSDDTDSDVEDLPEEDQHISGTPANDMILGGSGDDALFGRGGGDFIVGRDGDDRIFGADGSDLIIGNDGDDFIRGGADNDSIYDTEGADTINGDSGDDYILASGFIDADALSDTIAAHGVNTTAQQIGAVINVDFETDTDTQGDVIFAGAGTDTVIFGIDDTVSGGDGTDIFISGDWLSADTTATITDFDTANEVLVYSYSASVTSPLITVDYSSGATATSGDAFIMANGAHVVTLLNTGTAATASNVQLVQRG